MIADNHAENAPVQAKVGDASRVFPDTSRSDSPPSQPPEKRQILFSGIHIFAGVSCVCASETFGAHFSQRFNARRAPTCFPLNFLKSFHNSAMSVANMISVSSTIAWKKTKIIVL